MSDQDRNKKYCVIIGSFSISGDGCGPPGCCYLGCGGPVPGKHPDGFTCCGGINLGRTHPVIEVPCLCSCLLWPIAWPLCFAFSHILPQSCCPIMVGKFWYGCIGCRGPSPPYDWRDWSDEYSRQGDCVSCCK